MSNADLIAAGRELANANVNGSHTDPYVLATRLCGHLADALERAEQDARRYRWIRRAPHSQAKHFIRWTGGSPWLICDDELDRECDAELAKEGKNG